MAELTTRYKVQSVIREVVHIMKSISQRLHRQVYEVLHTPKSIFIPNLTVFESHPPYRSGNGRSATDDDSRIDVLMHPRTFDVYFVQDRAQNVLVPRL